MSERHNQHEAAGVGDLARRILEQLKDDLGDAWEQRLAATDRQLVESVSLDAANVLMLGLAGRRDDAAREKAQVNAQLLNLTSVDAARFTRQLWSSAAKALHLAMTFILL